MDGIYIAYLTGRGGNSVLLFAIKSGNIVGADIGGMTYNGFIEEHDGGFLMRVEYVVTPGRSLITGNVSVAADTPVKLDLKLSANFANGEIVGVETPFGPINAKISKLRSFDF